MTTESSRPPTAQDAPTQLAALVDTIERLHRDHTVAYIAAGDDKIYAYGGDGYVAIISQRVFGGLVEIETPTGTIRIEPNDAGEVAASGSEGESAAALGERLLEAKSRIERYYDKRFWKP